MGRRVSVRIVAAAGVLVIGALAYFVDPGRGIKPGMTREGVHNELGTPVDVRYATNMDDPNVRTGIRSGNSTRGRQPSTHAPGYPTTRTGG